MVMIFSCFPLANCCYVFFPAKLIYWNIERVDWRRGEGRGGEDKSIHVSTNIKRPNK
jgi:hypothetical protein